MQNLKEISEMEMKESATEISSLEELRARINDIPDGTVYSVDLEVIELGQET